MVPRQINALSVSRDTLNPLLNHTILRQRLDAIEHYKFEHGVRIARWPHYLMGDVARRLYKYKFNLAVKGMAAYMVYREVAALKAANNERFLSIEESSTRMANIGLSAGVLAAVCAII